MHTFEEFAKPVMKKLDWPTIFCNRLLADPDGKITGFQMRCEPGGEKPQHKQYRQKPAHYDKGA